jgi:pimeloyl-ACP methyl ester carboxylesterase
VTGPRHSQPPERRYVDTADGQVHYRELGSGAPLLLLHQTASSSVMWERAMGCLAEGRRLIAMDTPGFGGSDPPAAQPADGLAYYAGRVAGFLDALGLDRADVAGHHTGAMIAAELAAAHPERVGRLVMIGCVVIASAEERDERIAQIDRWRADSRGDYVKATLIPRLHLSVTTDDPDHFARELIAYLQAGPDYWWAYDAVYGYDAPHRLPLIGAPTLCVAGELEPQALIEWTRVAAALIPGAGHLEVPGEGAEMVFQAPATVAAFVGSFLDAGEPAR